VKSIKNIKNLITFICLVICFGALATPAPLELMHNIDLDAFQGKTFLQTMLVSKKGIKAQFDDDYLSTYHFASWNSIKQALDNFDGKIVSRVLGAFPDGKRGLRKFSQALEGKRFNSSNIVPIMQSNYEGNGNIYVLAHFFAMASSAGTYIRIDENNYFYNYGYKSGQDSDDVKSGRSYGASELHNANDASDVMYLLELENFLTHENDLKLFYTTLLEILTQSNSSGFSNPAFNLYAQTVATDFVTIYTAELDRHVMVDLRSSAHPWENDLAEATFVSIYSAASGKLMKDGILNEASLKDFWAMSSTGSGRSGIGIGRKDRRKLQRLICEYERESHSKLVNKLERIIGKRSDGDLFRGLMEFLNNKHNQAIVAQNAKAITQEFVNFLIQVQVDVEEITEYIE